MSLEAACFDMITDHNSLFSQVDTAIINNL